MWGWWWQDRSAWPASVQSVVSSAETAAAESAAAEVPLRNHDFTTSRSAACTHGGYVAAGFVAV